MTQVLELPIEALTPEGSESGALPVCLWQENPHGLVSLWDMYQIAANNLVHNGRVLQALQTNFRSVATPNERLGEGAKAQFLEQLEALKVGCKALNLVVTTDLIAWAVDDYSTNPHTWVQVSSIVEHLTVAYQQELSRHFFAHIPQHKAGFMRSVDQALIDPPYGQDAARAFPHSLRDMALSGNCFGCGFNDASVFHSMRVLEKGLEALAKAFSVPFKFENWHNVIEQLESKIRKIDSTFGLDWKDKQKFYSGAACEFMFIKDAWRNHVMHGRDEYDDEQTQNIHSHVCAFMKQLAVGGLTE